MADVESAVLYTLRVEAARFPHLDKERLSVLKQYVTMLVKVSFMKHFMLRRDLPEVPSFFLTGFVPTDALTTLLSQSLLSFLTVL